MKLFSVLVAAFGFTALRVGQAGRLRATPKVPTVREETCRFCYRQCPISCFVGTCGLEYGFAVKRYKFTNQCFTCDASSSVGVNKNGDFALCTADEAAATTTYIKKAKDHGPIGPGLPGDARAAAQAASDAANEAMKQAQLAAQKADEAAKAAVSKYNLVNQKASKGGNAEELAEAHRLAEQIRAQEAAKAAEAATAARGIAEQKYNVELQKLRKQQLQTDRAEEILMRAEKAGEEARAAYTQAAARAAQAARDAAMTGAVAAGQAAEQAEADEMASAARAAQRRAIVAAKSAKDAADKANIAASIAKIPPQPKPTLPPCDPKTSLLQTKGKQPQGCQLFPQDGTDPYASHANGDVAASVQENMPQQPQVPQYLQNMLEAKGVPQNQIQPAVAQQPQQAQPRVQMAPSLDSQAAQPENADVEAKAVQDGDVGTASDPLAKGDGTEDIALNPDGTPDTDRISAAMSQALAEKLTEHPEMVNQPRLYDPSTMPAVQAAVANSVPGDIRAEAEGVDANDGEIGYEAAGIPQGGQPQAMPNLPMDPNNVPGVGDVMAENGFIEGALGTF